MSQTYDRSTVLSPHACSPFKRLTRLLLPLALIVLVGCVAIAQDGKTWTTDEWIGVILCIVFLIIATAASGWYFGNKAHRVPFLIGIASFSAACGIGIGFSSEAAFAAIVPALAVAYGGALVCAVSVGSKTSTTADVLSNGSAASGIPLLLGAYFGSSFRSDGLWYSDPRRLLAAVLLLLVTFITSLLVARRKENLPLPLAGAAFGAFIGLVTGLSEHPVVAYVAPATLALFAGAASYAFSATLKEQKKIGGILLSFGVLLILGLFLGAIVRLGMGWDGALRTLFAFSTIMLVSLSFGGAVGALIEDVPSGLGFSVLGSGVGLSIGMSNTFVLHIMGPALLTLFVLLAIYAYIAGHKKRPSSTKLLATFGVVVLMGAFVGYSLREGDANTIIDIVQKPGDTADGTAIAQQVEEALKSFLNLEGNEQVSVIFIQAQSSFEGFLTIHERVDIKDLYHGTPLPEVPIVRVGESFRIRWPLAAGQDAISIRVWERITMKGKDWTVEGEGELLPLELAEVQGDEFVLDYSP